MRSRLHSLPATLGIGEALLLSRVPHGLAVALFAAFFAMIFAMNGVVSLAFMATVILETVVY